MQSLEEEGDRWREERPECCSKLCVNQEHVILPPTRRPSWLSGLGVDAPLRPGRGNFPTPQAPGLPEGTGAAAASVFLFTFPVLHFKNRVGSWKSLKGFSQQAP